MSECFHEALTYLCASHNTAIRALMAVASPLFEDEHVGFSTPVPIDTPTFSLAGDFNDPQGRVTVPIGWEDRFRADPTTETGNVLFVCSQAVDLYNGRYIGEAIESKLRARAYVAEYAMTLTKPSESLSAYLVLFPEGLRTRTVRHLVYVPRPYISLL